MEPQGTDNVNEIANNGTLWAWIFRNGKLIIIALASAVVGLFTYIMTISGDSGKSYEDGFKAGVTEGSQRCEPLVNSYKSAYALLQAENDRKQHIIDSIIRPIKNIQGDFIFLPKKSKK